MTSRAITVEQQAEQYSSVDKYDYKSLKLIRYWNQEVDTQELIADKGIQLMTYDKLIYTLINRNHEGLETLGRIKIVVLDECHTLFSDLFIRDVEAAKVWVRDTINRGNKIFIGMTATPAIVQFNKTKWGVSIHQVNKTPIVNYRAKRLLCSDFKTIPYIISSNKITGRTIIMCQSIKDCYELQKNLPNAAVLVSKNSSQYTSDMETIRDYIVKHESLPNTFMYRESADAKHCEERSLEVLICTSTAREGFSLRKESGVRNVISCFPDEMHITQFAGRCRFSLDTIVVVGQTVLTDNYDKTGYLAQQHEGFKRFMEKKESVAWFRTISHLVEASFKDIEYLVLDMNGAKFTNYINQRWLVPIGTENTEKYKIWRKKDKDEILLRATSATFNKYKRDKLTFAGVIKMMAEDLGYTVAGGREQSEDQRYTYKLVVGFDIDASIYKDEILRMAGQ